MMVKLWNDNIHDFKQKFRDRDIYIPAKGFIELDEDDAHNLVCLCRPKIVDAGGQQKPESFTILRPERPDDAKSNPLDPFKCFACGYNGVNKKDLVTHIEARLNDGKHVKLEDAGSNLSADEVISGLSEDALEILADKIMARSQPKKVMGRPKEV